MKYEDLNPGDIVRTKRQESSTDFSYWVFKNEFFRLDVERDSFSSIGPHFICLGNTYFWHCKGQIAGLELLTERFLLEKVGEAPENLNP